MRNLLMFIVVILISCLAYMPLVYAIDKTPTHAPYFTSSSDDFPTCVTRCDDTWETEGNFGKPW